MITIWDVSGEVSDRYGISDKFELMSDGLCEECFDTVLNTHCKNESASEREKKHIESQWKPEEYLSTGQHAPTNNGYKWS